MNPFNSSLPLCLLPALLAACTLASAQTPPTASAAAPTAAAASPANFIPPPKLTLPLILRQLHTAARILAREAFRAAADPKRFPEAGQPWQAKKLYTGNLAPGETPTVKLETTVVDPELGVSYAQLALNGLRHQLSQGAAGWQLPPGPRYSSYKLADTVLPNYKPEHEQDFLDGIDTSLSALAKRLGHEEEKVPNLRKDLKKVADGIQYS